MSVEPNLCADCGVDTVPCTGHRGCRHIGKWEHYMVHNALWRQAGDVDGFLWVGCLERRIGRQLTPLDFTEFPINWPSEWDTPRLAARKLSLAHRSA